MNLPRVSIVILNWNGYIDTIDCLESIKKIDYPNYEIIIVDNASSGDDVRMLKEKYGDYITVLENDKNYGFPEGCNIGMRYAMKHGTDYLALLNNDTIVDKAFLNELVEVAEANPSVGIVGSKIYYYYFPDRVQYVGGRINWLIGINDTHTQNKVDRGQYDKLIEQDYIPATSCVIKKEVVEKIGYLDPFYFFSIEEFDYCTRAKRSGFKVMYAPKSKVWHKWNKSGEKLPDFPETQEMIYRKVGKREYKLWWHLYKTYSPPVLFIIPFLLQVTLIGPVIKLMIDGKWGIIARGIRKRIVGLFSAR
jgi:GT2 family glycosyltransferase